MMMIEHHVEMFRQMTQANMLLNGVATFIWCFAWILEQAKFTCHLYYTVGIIDDLQVYIIIVGINRLKALIQQFVTE
jgi:hypothetical protein